MILFLVAVSLVVLAGILLLGCGGSGPAVPDLPAAPAVTRSITLPRPSHIVVVMEENKGYSDVIGSANAPYINSLLPQAALFTNSHGVTHPSEPNYLALFSGSTQGLTTDACPVSYSTQTNLGCDLLNHGLTWNEYCEDLPSRGWTGCSYAGYVRRHSPGICFTGISTSHHLPYAGYFPGSSTYFPNLATVSFVIPNLTDDGHSGSSTAAEVRASDTWLKNHMASYLSWAKANNSLLIIQWDEDDGTTANHIATLILGQHVKPGAYSEDINHYNLLRTIEQMYSLPYTGSASTATPILDCWQ